MLNSLMTVPWGRPGSGADLSCHRRRARWLPGLGVGQGSVWTDVLQISIGQNRNTGAISKCGDEMMRVMLYDPRVML